MKIYLASSWKNRVVVRRTAEKLRQEGFEVDDFTDSSRGRYVFHWTSIDENILNNLNAKTFIEDKRTKRAFEEDKKQIEESDIILVIKPCGKSSHIEAGYGKGLGKKLIIYYPTGLERGEFETLYCFADLITDDMQEIIVRLNNGAI